MLVHQRVMFEKSRETLGILSPHLGFAVENPMNSSAEDLFRMRRGSVGISEGQDSF